MSGSSERNLYSLANNLIELANGKYPFTQMVLGSTIQGELGAPEREFIVNPTQPDLPTLGYRVWVEVSTRNLYLSDIRDGKWVKILDYSEIFGTSLIKMI